MSEEKDLFAKPNKKTCLKRAARGYIGILAVLIVTIVAIFWIGYLWKKNWFGGRINIQNGKQESNQNKAVTEQLDDLRSDLNAIKEKRDSEIRDALEESGSQASQILDRKQ